MKIQAQQLVQQKLSPLYLIAGDEFLLVDEACDIIRKKAQDLGISERDILYVDSGFEWGDFLSSACNLSLFCEKKLIELHLNTKITEAGSKALQSYVESINKNKLEQILLIIAPKLESSWQKTAWFKACDSNGIVVQIWPINSSQFPAWVAKKIQQAKLKVDGKGVRLLAEYTAGNLLAAAQEIEKLHMLYGSDSVITHEQVITALTDHARFTVFNLVDECLNNNINNKKEKIYRIVNNLKLEGVEPAIILWALVKELRILINLKAGKDQYVWPSRKVLVNSAVSRHSVSSLQNLLSQAFLIDKIIKGADQQSVLWHELLVLCGGF